MALALELVYLGSWDGPGWVPRYSTLPDPTQLPTPGTPPPPRTEHAPVMAVEQCPSDGRGAQIGSSTHFRTVILRVQGITEVYNL